MRQQDTICDFSTSDSWVVLSPIEQSIKKKIEAVGTPLKDWDINIYRGVLTGCNEAFIIDTAKRDEIISNCQTEDERKRTAELIRPILRGRDIKRYGYEWAELWLIATFPSRHYNIDEYPAVKQYLLSFGIERLEQTGKTHIVNGEKVKSRKKTHNKWFETQDSISYWEDFNKPKIIYPDICTFLSFELDTSCFYLSNTAYFLITEKEEHLKYFLRVLNSSVIDWYYRTLSVQLGEKAVRMFSIYVLNIPIPPISDEPIEEILKLSKEEKLFISGS
ncbi:type II restriction endonuclease subunit M [Prevotella intermedia]|uniref:site-specific DNA-methyltransferase (adenine-specific) n=1 Tax=Prevotella intermedia TaxID=28131 RepID=A0A2M8TRN5_PREIN|nr:type II restriction endonuclease subunit M [Prevotella intermedia]